MDSRAYRRRGTRGQAFGGGTFLGRFRFKAGISERQHWFLAQGKQAPVPSRDEGVAWGTTPAWPAGGPPGNKKAGRKPGAKHEVDSFKQRQIIPRKQHQRDNPTSRKIQRQRDSGRVMRRSRRDGTAAARLRFGDVTPPSDPSRLRAKEGGYNGKSCDGERAETDFSDRRLVVSSVPR